MSVQHEHKERKTKKYTFDSLEVGDAATVRFADLFRWPYSEKSVVTSLESKKKKKILTGTRAVLKAKGQTEYQWGLVYVYFQLNNIYFFIFLFNTISFKSSHQTFLQYCKSFIHFFSIYVAEIFWPWLILGLKDCNHIKIKRRVTAAGLQWSRAITSKIN